VPVDQQRVRHVARDDGELVDIHVVDIVDDSNSFALS